MDGDTLAMAILGFMVIALIALATQRWFWLLVFGLSSIAALFTCIASIIHFQILAAVGFFVLACILAFATLLIKEG